MEILKTFRWQDEENTADVEILCSHRIIFRIGTDYSNLYTLGISDQDHPTIIQQQKKNISCFSFISLAFTIQKKIKIGEAKKLGRWEYIRLK